MQMAKVLGLVSLLLVSCLPADARLQQPGKWKIPLADRLLVHGLKVVDTVEETKTKQDPDTGKDAQVAKNIAKKKQSEADRLRAEAMELIKGDRRKSAEGDFAERGKMGGEDIGVGTRAQMDEMCQKCGTNLCPYFGVFCGEMCGRPCR